MVIAIIGVLVALLLPAVQSCREAARRCSCANNLGQLILAVQNYDMAHGMYPMGTINPTGPIANGPPGYHHNWLVQILPYIEEQNAYNSLDKKLSVYHPKNKPVVDAMPRWLVCPSCSAAQGAFVPCYAACHHEKEKQIDAKDHGVFYLNSFVRYDDITDGSSNTGIDNMTAAAGATQAHIAVDTVGIGARNQTTTVQGRVVDGVDEQALQQISTATGGHYYYAADEAQLSKIYSDLGSHIGWVTSKLDLTVPLLALGTIILVVGGLFSLRWFRLLP